MRVDACTTEWFTQNCDRMPVLLTFSLLYIGVFQRRVLLPAPQNEIRPLLQHASCKLLLMHTLMLCAWDLSVCASLCTCVGANNTLYIMFAIVSVSYFQRCLLCFFICIFVSHILQQNWLFWFVWGFLYERVLISSLVINMLWGQIFMWCIQKHSDCCLLFKW